MITKRCACSTTTNVDILGSNNKQMYKSAHEYQHWLTYTSFFFARWHFSGSRKSMIIRRINYRLAYHISIINTRLCSDLCCVFSCFAQIICINIGVPLETHRFSAWPLNTLNFFDRWYLLSPLDFFRPLLSIIKYLHKHLFR